MITGIKLSCNRCRFYAYFLPQIYLTLIISDLYLYGTKMSPQFE